MNVLFLSTSAEIGGAERALIDMISVLKNSGTDWDVHLLIPQTGPLQNITADLNANVHLLEMPAGLLHTGKYSPRNLKGLFSGLLYAYRFRQLVKQLRPDIVHSNGLKFHILSGLLLSKNTRLIWHIRDFLTLGPLTSRLLNYASKKVHVALAVSRAVERDVKSTLPNLVTRVIYDVVDTNYFTPSGAKSNEFKESPPHLDECVKVGMVATYAKWKGQKKFLRSAAELLKTKNLGAKFYIIGGPIYKTTSSQFSRVELEDYARELGILKSVEFFDFTHDIAPVYRALDIVVHASTAPEPFGLAPAEGMACGRAVVVSKQSGVAEMLESEKNALIIDGQEQGALTGALGNLISKRDLREKLGANGAKLAREMLTRNRLGSLLMDVYRD